MPAASGAVTVGVPVRRPGVDFESLPDGSAVLVDPGGRSYALNATGGAVWRLIDGRRTPNEIAQALREVFDAAPGEAFLGVVNLLTELTACGLLELETHDDRN